MRVDETVEGLVAGWLGGRLEGESFRDFCDRASDAELSVLAGREAALTKEAA